MAFRPAQLWSVGFESFLRHIQALPQGGLLPGHALSQEWVSLDVASTLEAFDCWFSKGYAALPEDPRNAHSTSVSLCTYERWFAVGAIEDSYAFGRWRDVPGYVTHTARIPYLSLDL